MIWRELVIEQSIHKYHMHGLYLELLALILLRVDVVPHVGALGNRLSRADRRLLLQNLSPLLVVGHTCSAFEMSLPKHRRQYNHKRITCSTSGSAPESTSSKSRESDR